MAYLWFAIPILLFLPVVLLGRGPAGPDGFPDPVPNPVDAHKSRLKNLEQDEARGLLSAQEAGEARVEVQRRLLKAARTADGLGFEKSGKINSQLLAVGFMATLALGLVFYSLTGAPTLGPSKGAIDTRLSQRLEPNNPDNTLTYGDAIQAIKAELAKDPSAIEGWRLLAETARSVGDMATAAEAYGQLADLGENSLENYLKQVQAMVALTQNQISPAVGLVLEKVAAIDPTHPAIDYYRGVIAMQAQNNADAVAIWSALIERSPKDAWYVEQLTAELARMGRPVVTASDGEPLAPPLDSQTLEAASRLSAAEQKAFVNSMLNRLKVRLADNPDDLEGWERLANAYIQLNRTEEARAIITEALAQIPVDKQKGLKALLDKLPRETDFKGVTSQPD